MMVAPWFLVLAAHSIPSGSGHPETEALAQLFIDACVYGELRLTSETGQQVSADKVSEWRRVKEGKAQYFEIRKPREALLRITDFEPATDLGVVRQCIVITGGHDLNTAWSKIAPAVSGGPEAKIVANIDEYEIDFPARRYRVVMSRNWMSSLIFNDSTAAKMVAEQPAAFRGRAQVKARKTPTIFD
jgi:hypothetical protein